MLRQFEETHLANQDSVCAVQVMDGSSAIDVRADMSAFRNGKETENPEKTQLIRAETQIDSAQTEQDYV